jgi:hypothetical protein
LAETGVATEDAVNTVDGYVLSPIRRILSEAPPEDEGNPHAESGGFEVIAVPNESPTAVGDMQIYFVEPAPDNKNRTIERAKSTPGAPIGIRETMSWAY